MVDPSNEAVVDPSNEAVDPPNTAEITTFSSFAPRAYHRDGRGHRRRERRGGSLVVRRV